jgi:hypothetical protein
MSRLAQPQAGSANSARRHIPRLVHQIYLSGALPAALQQNVDEMMVLNPDWEHRLYDAQRGEAFIEAHYGPDMLATYRRINPEYGAARADLLRLLILYREGGVYLDIKSRFTRPLDEIILEDDRFILSQWRNGPGEPHEGFGLHHDLAHVGGGEFQNFHIIAEPGHLFLKAAIDQVCRNIRAYRPWSAVGRTGVVRTTGPIAYTQAIYPLLESAPHRRVANECALALEYSPPGYDHTAAFSRHYSMLTSPVVSLGPIGRLASRLFVNLRGTKSRLR